MLGGAALGGAFGAVGGALLRRTPDHLTAILASTVLVFATALLAERLHASPVIAVVVAGLSVGRAARRHLEPSRVLAMQGFWEMAGFALNVLIFLLVGMQIQGDMLIREAASIGLALLALHAGRAVAVYGCAAVLRVLARDRLPMRWQHVMVFGNIKGALSMAAVLSLPSGMPHRDRLITIVFGVTFVTLMTQALPFQRILRLLKVAFSGSPAGAPVDAAKATLIAARRGQAELDDLLAAGLVSRKDHAERRAAFQRRIIEAEVVLRDPRSEPALDAAVEHSLLNAQKAALVDAARRGLLDAETASAQVNEIDRVLMRVRDHH
jgi:CPA1 family monovalent cation:H+ antiporter